jgi:hypothetical protein
VEVSDEEDEQASPQEQEEDFQCVVYFWEVKKSPDQTRTRVARELRSERLH